MEGKLELVVEKSAEEIHYLSHRFASPPFCISKPYDHGDKLQVQLQQVGPGLLGGDRATVDVEARNGGHLMLTSPSAIRLLPRHDQASLLSQKIRVRKDCCVEVWPEPLFPHKDCRGVQRNELVVEDGGVLFWFDALTPGRDCSGERFEWRELDLETKLYHQDRLLLWERLRGTGKEWGDLHGAFPGIPAWSGVFYICAPAAPESFFETFVSALHSQETIEGAEWAWTRPDPSLMTFKFVAKDGQGIRELRTRLQSAAASATSASSALRTGAALGV